MDIEDQKNSTMLNVLTLNGDGGASTNNKTSPIAISHIIKQSVPHHCYRIGWKRFQKWIIKLMSLMKTYGSVLQLQHLIFDNECGLNFIDLEYQQK